jgi:hypothetical protein
MVIGTILPWVKRVSEEASRELALKERCHIESLLGNSTLGMEVRTDESDWFP